MNAGSLYAPRDQPEKKRGRGRGREREKKDREKKKHGVTKLLW